jgi:hypothetical protein
MESASPTAAAAPDQRSGFVRTIRATVPRARQTLARAPRQVPEGIH